MSSDCSMSCSDESPDIINQPIIRYQISASCPSSSCETSSTTCLPACSTSTTSTTCAQKPCSYVESSPCYDDPVRRKKKFNNPDVCTFKTIITPLSMLTPFNSKFPGPIEFKMRRKNRVVSLQWEPFSGVITQSGIVALMMVQTIANLPQYPIWSVYNLEYNGVNRVCPLVVDPTNVKSPVLFYLNSNATSENVNVNDTVNVRGNCVSWIVSC